MNSRTSFNRDELKRLKAYRNEKRNEANQKKVAETKKKTAKKLNGYLDPNQVFTRGIYLLYWNTKVVYVGMSSENVMQRVIDHYKCADKQFNAFKCYPFKGDTKALLREEKDLIIRFRPKYNKVHNTPKRLKQVRG